jgi:hypothetical protein
MANNLWPSLRYTDWQDSYATVHMWLQVIGKIAVRHAVPENHGWAIAMQVTPRGLATKTLFHGTTPFSFELDFVGHQLVLNMPDERSASLDLGPMTVADFHAAVMRMCADAGIPVKIWTTPVEIPDPLKFERDTIHGAYDPVAITRVHRIFAQVDRVFRRYRAGFIGKCSPVHFFWGSFDLAVTRFSGDEAPPRPQDPGFMQEAYSHKVISHGFWPGNAQFAEPAFYAYAAPAPKGFDQLAVKPDGAFYHEAMGEFLLPYEAVRTAADPEQAILDFMASTYEHGAALDGWDRKRLETERHNL